MSVNKDYKEIVYRGQYDDAELETINGISSYLPDDPGGLKDVLAHQHSGEKLYWGMELNSGLPTNDVAVGSYELAVTANYFNPDNPLYTDKAYSRAKLGKQIACPLAFNVGVGFPYLPKYSPAWATEYDVTDPVPFGGLDHELTFYKPIFEGDLLKSMIISQRFIDVTNPDGNPYRKYRVIGEGETYNQDGEKVMSIYHSAVESRRIFSDRQFSEQYKDVNVFHGNFNAKGDARGGFPARTPHTYTEDDYELIKDLWSKEYIRGSETLYWEDVNVGDEPAWTCDGPFTNAGQGPNTMTMKEQSVRDVLMNKGGGGGFMGMPGAPKKLTKNESGIYIFDNSPGGPPRAARQIFMNTVGRDVASRLLTNWMGDDGWLYKLCWRLGGSEELNAFPNWYDRPSYLFKVPYLLEKGAHMNVHGQVGDLSINKAYVCGKYIADDGRHCVDLVVWCETIEGYIYAECFATVVLPTKA